MLAASQAMVGESAVVRYATPVLLGAAATMVVVVLPWPMPHPGLLLLYLLAVMLSSYRGGFGPGVLATAIGALAIAYFLPPGDSFRVAARSDIVSLGIFATMAALSTVTLDWLQAAAGDRFEQD